MPATETLFKIGGLVVLGETPWANGHKECYPGPFRVRAVDGQHLILEWIVDPAGRAQKGDVVHFGSTAEARVHSNHFLHA
jgi:hypothetical protein